MELLKKLCLFSKSFPSHPHQQLARQTDKLHPKLMPLVKPVLL